jgi:hypothetical protein
MPRYNATVGFEGCPYGRHAMAWHGLGEDASSFQRCLFGAYSLAPMLASLHRRLPGDVTLPNDARFIDWVAVVYSCWADLAGGSKGRSNGHP